MQGVITGGTGTAARLTSGQVAAGKTGTSENWRDSYFVGFTPQISVAIWIGAREERTMSSSITASSVFSDFVGAVLKDSPLEEFPVATYPTYTAYSNSTLGIGGSSSSVTPDSGSNSNSNNSGTQPDSDSDSTEEPSDDTSTEGGTTTPVDPASLGAQRSTSGRSP
jgi:penicillin-binding protein 1A